MNTPLEYASRRATLLLVCMLLACPVAADEINVPNDKKTIQAAIDAAADDDTIMVEPNTYRETIALRGKNGITISGRETARTILKPATSSKPIFTLDDSSDITFKNFTLLQANIGVSITKSNDFRVSANVFHLGDTGVAVTVSSDSDGDITNNTFYKNRIGTQRAATDTRIKNNLFVENDTAISNNAASTSNISYNGYYINTNDGTVGSNNIAPGDPLFASVDNEDFHLQAESDAIDAGSSTDSSYDESVADLGTYGGGNADTYPYPVTGLAASIPIYDAVNYSLTLQWADNTDYRIRSYKLYSYIEGAESAFNMTAGIDVGDTTSYPLSGTVPVTVAPAAPTMITITPRDQSLTVTWSTVSGATSYELRYGVDSTAENIVSVGNVLSYVLSGLTNGTPYKIRVHAIAQATLHAVVTARNAIRESYALSNEFTVVVGPAYTSNASLEVAGSPEATVSYPQLPDEGCFIATAAYGHYSAPQVQALRDFRDAYLMHFDTGRNFVHWYYAHGPAGARILNDYPTLKIPVRAVLYPLVLGALFLTQAPGWTHALVLLGLIFMVAFAILRSRKKTPCAVSAQSS